MILQSLRTVVGMAQQMQRVETVETAETANGNFILLSQFFLERTFLSY